MIVNITTTGFGLLLDKIAGITYFLDIKPLFYIPHLTMSYELLAIS
jgi:hypothetical protein